MPEVKDYSLDITSLHITKGTISSYKKLEQVPTREIYFLTLALKSYFIYQEVVNGHGSLNPKIEDLPSFLEHGSTVDLDNIANFLEKESNQTSEPEKTSKQRSESDQNNIPAELETMVALYKQHQADLLDSEREHTVSDTVKNIRKAWLEREKHRLIYENASKKRQKQIDEEREKFFRQSVDSKRTYQETVVNIRQVAEGLLVSQGINLSPADKEEAIQRIVYAAQTRAIVFDPKNTSDLYKISLLVKKDFLDLKTEIDKVDEVVQNQLKNIEIDNTETDNYKNDTELTYAEQDVNTQYSAGVEAFDRKFKKYASENDLDGKIDTAKNDANRIITGLNKAIPNPRTLYRDASLEIDKYKEELEKAIYEDSLEINKKYQLQGSAQIQLRPNTVGNETRVSGTLSQTGGGVSSTVVDLYSRGITPQKLNQILSLPKSKTLEVLSKNKLVQTQVQKQLERLHESELGKGISKGLEKLRPLSDSYYRLSGTAQKILDPVGTTKDYLNKKIGQYAGRQIIKNTSNAAAQKFGKYILENGLKEGAKKFADAAAKKLLIEGAKAVGVQTARVAGMAAADTTIAAIAAAAGIPTMGVSLIIGAIIIAVQIGYEITVGLIKKGIKEIKDALGITKKDDEESRKALLLGLAALAASAVVLKRSGQYFSVATKAAILSAAGIIWLSLATIAVFLTLTFMVAPLLSTLVQFDSEEKVQYLEPIVDPDDQTADCGSGTVNNDKSTCRGNYCFPVADKSKVSYLTYHHEYPAQDIMRIGDKPGSQDDVPLAVLAYTSGTIVNMNDGTGGLSVWLAGDDGRFYWFTHLSKTTTSGGIKVKAGDIIGCMGTSGNAEGYLQHLHFHISTKSNMATVPENYPNFIWPYQDFCRTVGVCGSLNPEQYPEYQYL